MKYARIFIIFLSLLFGCAQKEKADGKFTEFTKKIDEDMQDLFSKKEAMKDTLTVKTDKKIATPERKETAESVKTDDIKEVSEFTAKIEPETRIVPQQPEMKPEKIIEPVKKTGLSTSELWDAYRKTKAELENAQKSNQFDKIIELLKKTIQYAKELDRLDIAAWQMNNIGYYSIEEFKWRTSYDTRFNKLNQMQSGDEKMTYLLETKKKFASEYFLLKNALPYLQEAEMIDKNMNDEKRIKIINSNILFIQNIKNTYLD
jgi:hypothetical protein